MDIYLFKRLLGLVTTLVVFNLFIILRLILGLTTVLAVDIYLFKRLLGLVTTLVVFNLFIIS